MKIDDIIQGGKARRKVRGVRHNRINGASLVPIEVVDDCEAECDSTDKPEHENDKRETRQN